MQLTSFDRWLRVKFVQETHILTLRPLEHTPKGIKRIDLPKSPARRFNHLYKSSKPKAIDKFLTMLKDDNQMFSTTVVDKDTWLAQFVAPEGKSPTWYLVSVFCSMAALALVVSWVRDKIKDPEFMENLRGALDIIKG
jgi:hypothetical protein